MIDLIIPRRQIRPTLTYLLECFAPNETHLPVPRLSKASKTMLLFTTDRGGGSA
jgi:hypothetical protein